MFGEWEVTGGSLVNGEVRGRHLVNGEVRGGRHSPSSPTPFLKNN